MRVCWEAAIAAVGMLYCCCRLAGRVETTAQQADVLLNALRAWRLGGANTVFVHGVECVHALVASALLALQRISCSRGHTRRRCTHVWGLCLRVACLA
jgi:hypothetical protein